jgi:hypothetical protein
VDHAEQVALRVERLSPIDEPATIAALRSAAQSIADPRAIAIDDSTVHAAQRIDRNAPPPIDRSKS